MQEEKTMRRQRLDWTKRKMMMSELIKNGFQGRETDLFDREEERKQHVSQRRGKEKEFKKFS